MKSLAQVLSIIGHPIWVLPLLILFCYYNCQHTFLFADDKSFGLFVIYSVVSGLLLPIVAIAMMKGLGLISSWQMPNKQERIGPLIVTGLFYIWLFYNYYKSDDVPQPVQVVTLGAAIGLFLAFFMNNFSKLSLHGVGFGGLVMGLVLVALRWGDEYATVNGIGIHVVLCLVAVLILAGLVLTSRLILKAHNLQQIYHGVLIGIMSQLIAFNILT